MFRKTGRAQPFECFAAHHVRPIRICHGLASCMVRRRVAARLSLATVSGDYLGRDGTAGATQSDAARRCVAPAAKYHGPLLAGRRAVECHAMRSRTQGLGPRNMPANGCAAVKASRIRARRSGWVHFTISSIVGFGDDMSRERPPPRRLVRRRSLPPKNGRLRLFHEQNLFRTNRWKCASHWAR